MFLITKRTIYIPPLIQYVYMFRKKICAILAYDILRTSINVIAALLCSDMEAKVYKNPLTLLKALNSYSHRGWVKPTLSALYENSSSKLRNLASPSYFLQWTNKASGTDTVFQYALVILSLHLQGTLCC